MLIIDQIGHKFKLDSTPKRIISLVPSQTELLSDLGLEEEVIGITKFCIHPKKWFKTKIRVGGTKNIQFNKIAELNPDLIIANKEENTKEQIEALQKLYPVYTSDISNLDESIEMIKTIGTITNRESTSNKIIIKINQEFERLEVLKKRSYSVLYLIWKEPYMTINQNTFINDMMQRCGFNNVILDENKYPELTATQISTLNPYLIFLSSEPYPFKEKHIEALQIISPNSKIVLVDGEYFSWYGSRLKEAVSYFIALMDKIP